MAHIFGTPNATANLIPDLETTPLSVSKRFGLCFFGYPYLHSFTPKNDVEVSQYHEKCDFERNGRLYTRKLRALQSSV